MTTLQKTYVKDGMIVHLSDKFIYCIEIYKLWDNGFALVDEKHYSSPKPITVKKNFVKKKGYSLQRFCDLVFAPENYLINNGFKILDDETGSC